MRDYSSYFKASNQILRVVDLGKLYMPSGRIFCCDPFLSDEVGPLKTTLSPGQYEVQLSIATSSEWGPRVALAALVISTEPTLAWHEAVYGVNDQMTAGFRVDAGLACFMDEETKALFTRVVDEFYEKNPEGNYYDDILAAEFKQNAEADSPRQSGDWALHHPIKGDPRNIAMFASGLGDGFYPAYWGMDEMDQPAMLMADFQLLPEQNKPIVAYRLTTD